MEIKPKLAPLLDQADEYEQAFLARLTDAERAAPSAPDHWTAKDVVAHIAAWKQHMAERLVAAARREAPPSYDDFDKENARIYEEYRNQSWQVLLGASAKAQKELITQTQATPESDLVDPERFAWQRGLPLWRGIANNGYAHPVSHLVQFLAGRGDTASAIELAEQSAEPLLQLDGSQQWRGVTIYNLACNLALCGQKERAIERLREALQLDPSLVEWSKQDTDLASIRGEPAYKALYAG